MRPSEAYIARMAVGTTRGVAPQARARVLGTRTDSERLAVRREGAKGRFQRYVGTCRRVVATRQLARRCQFVGRGWPQALPEHGARPR